MPRRVNENEIRRPVIIKRVLKIVRAAAADWTHSPSLLERELRDLGDLRAADRRYVGEGVYGLIRWRRRLAALCGGEPDTEAGFDRWLELGDDDPQDTERARAEWLQHIIERTPPVPADDAATTLLGERWSFPDWIIKEAQRVATDAEDLERMLAAFNHRAPLVVRANRLRGTRDALVAALAIEGVKAQPIELNDDGLALDGHQNAYALNAFKNGLFEIQDAGSQLIAEVTAPPPGGLIIDACAGAGGKTLALGARLANRGRLIALDVRGKKLEELRRRARRAGLSNVQALEVDAHAPLATLQKHLGRVDRVLVDAPCTGLGVLRRHPEARWRLAADEPREMAKIQAAILRDYAPLVAVGGRLIYATCSFSPTENDEIVDQFLAERADFIEVTTSDILSRARAERIGDGRRLRVLPHRHDTDGFFAAVLRRVK